MRRVRICIHDVGLNMKAMELVKKDVSDLLQRAERGEALSETDRREVLAYMLFSRGDCWPVAALAEFFRCSPEEIEDDLAEIRYQVSAEARDLDLQAELIVTMRQQIAALDKYIAENADRLRAQDYAMLLRERRELVQSTLAQIARLKGW